MTASTNRKVITQADFNRIVEQVQGPDHVFDLRDVAKAVAAEFDVPLEEAKRVVRNWDRRMTGFFSRRPSNP